MELLSRLDLHDLSPARLWAALDPADREEAARCLYRPGGEQVAARREADRAIAAALNFREVAVRKLPAERRIGYLLRAVHADDALASTLLTTLHLEERVPLLEAFLDHLGIPQSDGLIDEDHEVEPPSAERLRGAVAHLREGFPAERVELYLASLLAMDPETWGALADVVSGDD